MYKLKERIIIEKETEIDVTLLEYIGKRVKAMRNERKWKQEDLSERISISRASVSNIEVGRHGLTMEVLESLCDVFNCKSTDILPF